MENPSTSPVPRASSFLARGREPGLDRVAIVDIGSNSVRLVAFQGLTRVPTPIFNEKVLAGLGKGVLTTGLLDAGAMARALHALRGFRVLCGNMGITDVRVLATAAARDADNGPAFLADAAEAIGARIDLLPGSREADLSAKGVISSIHQADGVVGDLGGGSLELVDIHGGRVGTGVSMALGGLALMDRSNKNPRRAHQIVKDAFADCPVLDGLRGRSFYAVGGTWRALARLHMRQRSYPLNVMHGYTIPTRDALDFAKLVERVEVDALNSISSVTSARRPLLAYGALVLGEILRKARAKEVVISALGVREGLLYEGLDVATRAEDPLLTCAREMNALRSRAPLHGEDLCGWSDQFFRSTHLEETADEVRLRHAACLLADIAWRAHPDYRGEEALNTIAHAAFTGVDHPGRTYLALAVGYRHLGIDEDIRPQLRALVSARMLDRARVLGAAMRVAYLVSAAMGGVLPRTPLREVGGKLVLTVPEVYRDIVGERLASRLKQLAKLLGREPKITVA